MGGCVAIALLAAAAPAFGQMPAPTAPSRGQLLYDNYCIACHSMQVHWRKNKLATDWPSLKGQVRRWQSRMLLSWSEEDIQQVTRYLNDTIYRYPPPTDQVHRADDSLEGRGVASTVRRPPPLRRVNAGVMHRA